MADFQTASSAIAIVQLAYDTYIFFNKVANAHEEARGLSEKVSRLFDLILSVDRRLELRKKERSLLSVPNATTEEEAVIMDTVQASVQACRKCLTRLTYRLTGLDEVEFSRRSRFLSGIRFTWSEPQRAKEETALTTRIQELSTSLLLLQLIEHARTQLQLDALGRQVAKALGYLESLALIPPNAPTPLNQNPVHGPFLLDEDNELLGVQSLKNTLEVARSISEANPDAQSVAAMEDLRNLPAETDIHVSEQSTPNETLLELNVPTASFVPETTNPDPPPSASGHPTDVPLTGPSPRLPSFKASRMQCAVREIEKGNYSTAEEHLQKVMEYGHTLEQHKKAFTDRREVQEYLVDCFLNLNRPASAVNVLWSLIRDMVTVSDEQELERSKGMRERARLWRKLGQAYHQIAGVHRKNNNNDSAEENLSKAEDYACKEALTWYFTLRASGAMHFRDPELQTALQLAIDIYEYQGNVLEADVLREELDDSFSPTTRHSSIVSQMSSELEIERVRKRLEQKFALLQTAGRPPLSNAIVFNLPDHFQSILEELLADGNDLNERCEKKWTPLMHAVNCAHRTECGCEKAIEKLVHHGANINAITTDVKRRVVTALHQAVMNGNINAVSQLIKKGADMEACRPFTPLVAAVKSNQSIIASHLLDHDANPSVLDANRQTLLHHAVNNNALATLQVLLSRQHRDRFNIEAKSVSGKTPLLTVAELATNDWALGIAKELLGKGANPNATERGTKRTAFHYATSSRTLNSNCENFVQLLLEYNGDPNCTPREWRENFGLYNLRVEAPQGRMGQRRP